MPNYHYRVCHKSVIGTNDNLRRESRRRVAGPFGEPRPVRANDFLNSIGVGTHMSQGADAPAQVIYSVNYAGIRNIREDDNPNLVPTFISVALRNL
jgi:hypothetical protein